MHRSVHECSLFVSRFCIDEVDSVSLFSDEHGLGVPIMNHVHDWLSVCRITENSAHSDGSLPPLGSPDGSAV